MSATSVEWSQRENPPTSMMDTGERRGELETPRRLRLISGGLRLDGHFLLLVGTYQVDRTQPCYTAAFGPKLSGAELRFDALFIAGTAAALPQAVLPWEVERVPRNRPIRHPFGSPWWEGCDVSRRVDLRERLTARYIEAPRTGNGKVHYCDLVKPERLAELAHLRRARDLMDREFDRPLDVAAIARKAMMSPAHFSRRFRATYGETPNAYLMTRRMERAKALLRVGKLSITEVCMAVGWSSLGSFSARFTQLVGETPSAYLNADHSALEDIRPCLARDITRPVKKPSRIGEAELVTVR